MLTSPLVLILYVVTCWLVGYLGRNTKFSFWGNFWVSIVLTPIVGIVVLLAQDNRAQKEQALPVTRRP